MEYSLLWSLGLILSIIIFAIDLGLILSFERLSKKSLAIFSIISFVCTFILIYLINSFSNQLGSFIGAYNYLLLFLISFILIFIGYLINKGKNSDLKLIIVLSYLCFILMAFMCILSNKATFGLNSFQISIVSSILFIILFLASYFAFKKFDVINDSSSLGGLYYIFGIYCLVVSLFLPNIIALDLNQMSPINIVSIESLVLTLVLIVLVAVFGLLYYRKNTMFK